MQIKHLIHCKSKVMSSSTSNNVSPSTPGVRLALSGTAASLSEVITYPLDFLKTRQQLEKARTPRSSKKILLDAVRREGLSGLYAGVGPAVARHLVYTPIRVILFERLRDADPWAKAVSHWREIYGRAKSPDRLGSGDESGEASIAEGAFGRQPSFGSLLVSGLLAGGIAQTIATPIDFVKVRLQSAARHGAPTVGIRDVITDALRTEGVKGLWRGAGPSVARAGLVNLGELSTYSIAKRAVIGSGVSGFKDDGILTHVASATCSGFVAALISTPADVLKSRIMAGVKEDDHSERDSSKYGRSHTHLYGRYPGAWRTLMHILRSEGARGLYGGFVPGWLRLAPWQLVYWVSYEKFRELSGLPSF